MRLEVMIQFERYRSPVCKSQGARNFVMEPKPGEIKASDGVTERGHRPWMRNAYVSGSKMFWLNHTGSVHLIGQTREWLLEALRSFSNSLSRDSSFCLRVMFSSIRRACTCIQETKHQNGDLNISREH